MASLLPLPLLISFLLLLNPSSAQTSQNITLGTTLSTLDQTPYWLSPSGEFAFGFYSTNSNLFLLSIWFAKIPLKTIVWTANRDQPVEKGSKLQLTSNGVLSLTNTTGSEIWKRESSNPNTLVSSAALLNTGNFVLQSNGSFLWASFDEPSDTILPGQTLDRTGKLVARTNEDDHSSGRFQLLLRSHGSLVLQAIARPTDGTYDLYWTNKNTENANSQLVFNESGYIYLNPQNGTVYNLTSETPVSTRDFYQRATLDFDGVFRKYTYPRSGITSESEGWSASWSVPGDICIQIRGDVGSGACGFNSYCVMGQDQRPSCLCPPGYDYLDSNDTFKGCKQIFSPQSCKIGDGALGGFEMRELINTDWPLSDYEHFLNVNEDWCSKTCLDDCFCAVSIIREGDCWLKKIPLSYGKRDPSVGGKALVKVGNSSLQTVVPPPPQLREDKNDKKDRGHRMILPGSIILGCSLFFNLLLLVIPLGIYMKRKRGLKTMLDQVAKEGNLLAFSYRDLEQATNGFKEELGKGAFSAVYKGVLGPNAGGGIVAVKKLEKIVREVDKEFKTEMSAIGQTNHKNLARLLGFCNEGTHRLLVYEFMSNGSLANFLFQNPRPSWYRRIQIAFGIARGLAYLHEECSTQIIHCDVKPQNILIDESYTARISDFGLAKLLKSNQTGTSTGIRGTRGYVAPEWFKSKAITAKVDVYSFGIMLMEIIFCRRNAELKLGEEDAEILSECVYDSYVQGQLHLLVGDDEEAKNDGRRMEKMVMVAIWCVQDDPSLRPSMRKVTQMLEGAADVPNPPDPYSFMSSAV